VEAKFSAPVQTDPGAHSASCIMGTGFFPGVKSGRDVKLTPHPLLVPWSRKNRAIPVLPLWALFLFINNQVNLGTIYIHTVYTYAFFKTDCKNFKILTKLFIL